MKKELNTKRVSFDHAEYLIILLIKILGPVIILVTGLVLLALRLSGWSVVLGLPLVVIGSVLLIYAYDEIVSRKNKHIHSNECNEEPEPIQEEG